jgi:hypothetical protein
LEEANQIRGHTDLKSMKAWPFAHAIQRMGNEMLASAGRARGTADGAFKHTAVSRITPNGMADGSGRRRSSKVRLDCELQKPSFESDVGTEK